MSKEFQAAIKQLAAEKNLDELVIIQAVEQALATAYRKDYGNKDQEIEVEIPGGNIESAVIYLVKEITEEVLDDNYEITLKEAKKINPNAQPGDIVRIDVTPVGYGRIAAQAAKQVIHQKIQEAERDSLFQKFKTREGEVLYGVVNRVEGTNVTLDIEKNMVNLPYKQQIPNEDYFTGKRVCVLLDKVHKTTKGPSISISRSSSKLVEKLLEREIPEISDGDVEIISIARDSGNRSKVSVKSNDANIDPIGACVGSKGSRINIVTEELGGERIDMIEWDENPAKLIARALQPSAITKVIIINNEEGTDEHGRFIKKRAAVFVEENQRAMAIGRKGQNIRLATDLTGYELDMYNIEELPAFEKKLAELKQQVISYEGGEDETKESGEGEEGGKKKRK